MEWGCGGGGAVGSGFEVADAERGGGGEMERVERGREEGVSG